MGGAATHENQKTPGKTGKNLMFPSGSEDKCDLRPTFRPSPADGNAEAGRTLYHQWRKA
jgi:hypothetical protein